tara:strand:- start:646 stop:1392 length:747 start_codon:yes stop_codon:yes gene_type:complete
MARALNNLSVSKIKANLLNVAQSSLYKLTLSIPQAVSQTLNLDHIDYENISLMCCEANLPGSSLTTHEVNNDYHGVTEKMAYRRMYDESIALAFYVDRDYKVIELLEGWMDYITGVNNKQDYKGEYISYRMAYPNSYKNNIYLTKFEKDQFTRDYSATRGASTRSTRTTLDYTFVNAFPLSLTAIPVSYEGSQALKVNVSFNFIRYVMEKKKDLNSPRGFVGTRDASLLNRDPTIGANDLLGITANFA